MPAKLNKCLLLQTPPAVNQRFQNSIEFSRLFFYIFNRFLSLELHELCIIMSWYQKIQIYYDYKLTLCRSLLLLIYAIGRSRNR